MWVLCKNFRECSENPDIQCEGEHIVPHKKDATCDLYCEFAQGSTPCLEIFLKKKGEENGN